MAYTDFGEQMRILRIKNHEVMGDSAQMLGVSASFLSAVENGKKNVPNKWLNILADHYHLNDIEVEKMKIAIENSKTQTKINLSNANPLKREAALKFARSFDNMDEKTAEKIITLLNQGERNGL